MSSILNLSDSLNGQKATKWGPLVWYLLITTTYYWQYFKYYSCQHSVLMEYFSLYLVLIYCRFCRNSFRDFWFVNDPRFCRKPLYEWLLWLHAKVNIKLEKPVFPLDQVEPTFIEPEKPYWERDQVSDHWQICYFTNLYLIACNYPPKIIDNEKCRKIQIAAKRMFEIAPQLIPISYLRHVQMTYPIDEKAFESRQSLFRLVFQLETTSNKTSRFGEDLESVAKYFECEYRSTT